MPDSSPPPVASPGANHHILELDGLRAIAIWLVLVAHLLDETNVAPSAYAKLPPLVRLAIDHGFLGVDLFFVLSGFLITSILVRTKQWGIGRYFRRFYSRRTLRILPLYFVVLVAIAVASGAAYWPYYLLATFLSANLSGPFNIDVPDAAGPYWSLAVEEQFYLVWPWLVYFGSARLVAALAIGVVIAEPIARLYDPDYFLTWLRADGLAAGAFLAIFFANWNGDRKTLNRLLLISFGSLVVLTAILWPLGGLHPGRLANAFRITQAALAFATLLAIAVGYRGSPWLAPLRMRVATYTAVVSYCLYIVHRPIAMLVDAGVARFAPRLGDPNLYSATLVRAFVVVVVAYTVATLSWRYFESPILSRAKSEADAVSR